MIKKLLVFIKNQFSAKWKDFQGKRGELKVAKFLRQSGYEVMFMPEAHEGYDMKARMDQSDPWIKIQIKTTMAMSKNGENSKLHLTKNNGTALYVNNEFDWLIAYNPKTGELWKLPYDAVQGKRKMSLPKKFRVLPVPIISL